MSPELCCHCQSKDHWGWEHDRAVPSRRPEPVGLELSGEEGADARALLEILDERSRFHPDYAALIRRLLSRPPVPSEWVEAVKATRDALLGFIEYFHAFERGDYNGKTRSGLSVFEKTLLGVGERALLRQAPAEAAPKQHRVYEYDGAFKCLDCKATWGALTNAPKEPPIECFPARPAEAAPKIPEGFSGCNSVGVMPEAAKPCPSCPGKDVALAEARRSIETLADSLPDPRPAEAGAKRCKLCMDDGWFRDDESRLPVKCPLCPAAPLPAEVEEALEWLSKFGRYGIGYASDYSDTQRQVLASYIRRAERTKR